MKAYISREEIGRLFDLSQVELTAFGNLGELLLGISAGEV